MSKYITGSVIGFIGGLVITPIIKKKIETVCDNLAETIAQKIITSNNGCNILPAHKEETPSILAQKEVSHSVGKKSKPTSDTIVLSDFFPTETLSKIKRLLQDSDESTIRVKTTMGDLKRDQGLIYELFIGPARMVVDETKDFFNFISYQHPNAKDINSKYVVDSCYSTDIMIDDIIIPVDIKMYARDMSASYEERAYEVEIFRKDENNG